MLLGLPNSATNISAPCWDKWLWDIVEVEPKKVTCAVGLLNRQNMALNIVPNWGGMVRREETKQRANLIFYRTNIMIHTCSILKLQTSYFDVFTLIYKVQFSKISLLFTIVCWYFLLTSSWFILFCSHPMWFSWIFLTDHAAWLGKTSHFLVHYRITWSLYVLTIAHYIDGLTQLSRVAPHFFFFYNSHWFWIFVTSWH